jgi:hypothetical protein
MPRRIPHSGKIDLDHFDRLDEVLDRLDVVGVIRKAMTEVIAAAAEEKADAYFPLEWEDNDGIGGAIPKDPMTIYVTLPLGDENNPPYWEISLRELIIQVIDDSGVSFETEAKLRDGLRELADMLDRDIKAG